MVESCWRDRVKFQRIRKPTKERTIIVNLFLLPVLCLRSAISCRCCHCILSISILSNFIVASEFPSAEMSLNISSSIPLTYPPICKTSVHLENMYHIETLLIYLTFMPMLIRRVLFFLNKKKITITHVLKISYLW